MLPAHLAACTTAAYLALRADGRSAVVLKGYAFEAAELREAGFSAKELKGALTEPHTLHQLLPRGIGVGGWGG